jgi:hypothetical protein
MINTKETQTSATIVCNEKEAWWKHKFSIASVGLEL